MVKNKWHFKHRLQFKTPALMHAQHKEHTTADHIITDNEREYNYDDFLKLYGHRRTDVNH